MEKAILISEVKNLKYATPEYSRLYFGVEFCQNLIPSVEDLNRVVEFISKNKMEFTFVTPFLTNAGIKKIKLLLNFITKVKPDAEIVINDWGLLGLITREYPGLNLSLGRLLSKQKRGPQILNLLGKVPEDMIRHFQQSNIDSSVLSNFLVSRHIKRVELDNLFQGISRPFPSLRGSLYMPFAYVTTTRICLFSLRKDNADRISRVISPCHKKCRERVFMLKHKKMPADLLLKGNTQFFKNEQLPDNLEDLSVDRIVDEPEILELWKD
jgi:hypothetical protein